MDVELEAAVDNNMTGEFTVDEANAWKWVAALLGTLVTGGLGVLIKRQRSGNILDDTENATKTDLIESLRKRNRELEEQLGEMLAKSVAGYSEINEAQRAAGQARIEADRANDAARRASEAADHAQRLAETAVSISAKRLAYIHVLRAKLAEHNIPLPEWPEGVL